MSSQLSQLSLFATRRQPRRPRRLPPLNVRTRETGFRTSRVRAGLQAVRVLELLEHRGPLTDHDISAALALPLASINSTRGALVKRGFVRAFDTVAGLGGARRTRWRLERFRDVS